MNRQLLIQIALLLFLLNGCGSPDVAIGGTDTELVGKPVITGAIYSLAGDPVPDIEVKLIPSDYRPGIDSDTLVQSSLTDDSGTYSIPVSLNISYNLLVRDTVQHESLFENKVIPAQTEKGTITLGSDTLSKSGAVTVTIHDSIRVSGAVISITGTDIFTSSSESNVLITELPTGDLPDIIVYDETSEKVASVIDEVVVDATDTTTLPYDYSVLFLYDAHLTYTYQVDSHIFLINELKNLFKSVTVQKLRSMDTVVISSYNTVFIVESTDSLIDTGGYNHTGTFASTTVPVVVGSYQLFDDLNFTDSEVTQNYSEERMIPEVSHVITPTSLKESLSFNIFKDGSSGNISAADPAGSGNSLLSGQNKSNLSTLFVYEKTKAMGNGKVAPGRRAAVFEVDDYRNLSDESLRYIKRTLLWSVGEL